MSKSKLFSLLLLIIPLIIPGIFSTSHVSAIELVDVSTHFIDVPAGSFGTGTIKLAATLYQPRFFPFAPAAVYIHWWGGHPLIGGDNFSYYIFAGGCTRISFTARWF